MKMNFDDLTPEQQKIVEKFKELSQSQKKAAIASLEAFNKWIKEAIPFVLTTIMQAAISEIFHHIIASM